MSVFELQTTCLSWTKIAELLRYCVPSPYWDAILQKDFSSHARCEIWSISPNQAAQPVWSHQDKSLRKSPIIFSNLLVCVWECVTQIGDTFHESVHLSLFKIVCFVVQSDLITLALLSINLERDICIGPCVGQVWSPDPQRPWVLWAEPNEIIFDLKS